MPHAVAGGDMWEAVEFVLVKIPGFGSIDGREVEHQLYAIDPGKTPANALRMLLKGTDAFIVGAQTDRGALESAAREAGLEWASLPLVERKATLQETIREVENRVRESFLAGKLIVYRP